MTSGDPTFVVGLGAQKAGTTWLYEYLRDSPEFDTGFRKEYHIWDLIEPALEPHRRKMWLDRAALEVQRLSQDRRTSGGPLQLASMLADPERYFTYFAGLLRGPVRATGDLTPAYGVLPPERLQRIRDGFTAHGVRTTAVMILRDPVERIWSAARMFALNASTTNPPTLDHDDAGELVRNVYKKPRYAVRARYDHTLAALDATFDRSESLVEFYERLFTRTSTAAICELIGIDHHDPEFERRTNVSAKEVKTLPEDVERMVAQHYAPVYEAVAARFPDVDLTSLWPSAHWVL